MDDTYGYYVDQELCPEQTIDCYFLRYSNCTAKNALNVYLKYANDSIPLWKRNSFILKYISNLLCRASLQNKDSLVTDMVVVSPTNTLNLLGPPFPKIFAKHMAKWGAKR
jgi:hypothetical protein